MRRNFLTKHDVTSSPLGSPQDALHLEDIRQHILNSTLLGALILGGVALIIAVPASLQEGSTTQAFIYIILYIWLVVVTLARRLPYHVRAGSLLVILLVLSLTSLLNDGMAGNGRIFLIALPLITAILFTSRSGFLSLLLSWCLMGGIAYLGVRRILLFPGLANDITPQMDPLDSSLTVMVFILVSGALFGSVRAMSLGLHKILANEENLSADLQAERAQLERRVQLRTQDLERRVTQIRTAADISNKLNAILNPQELLQQVVELIRVGFDLYYVGIYEVNETGDLAVLKSASGEVGRQMIDDGHQLPLTPASLVGWAILNRKARVAFDFGQDAVRFDYPLLPETRSEMVIPLLTHRFTEPPLQLNVVEAGRSYLGAITLHSKQPIAFDAEDVSIVQNIANSLAIALENARLFQQVSRNLEDLSTLNRQYLRDSWSRVLNYHGILSFSTDDVNSPEESDNFQTYSAPLVLRDQIIGMLTLENKVKDGEVFTLSPEDRVFLDAVATEAALALENVRLLEETHKRANNERLLSEISRKARSSTDLETILSMAVKELGIGLGASESLIRLQVPPIDMGEASQQDASIDDANQSKENS